VAGKQIESIQYSSWSRLDFFKFSDEHDKCFQFYRPRSSFLGN
jgi:hypothetical protein